MFFTFSSPSRLSTFFTYIFEKLFLAVSIWIFVNFLKPVFKTSFQTLSMHSIDPLCVFIVKINKTTNLQSKVCRWYLCSVGSVRMLTLISFCDFVTWQVSVRYWPSCGIDSESKTVEMPSKYHRIGVSLGGIHSSICCCSSSICCCFGA